MEGFQVWRKSTRIPDPAGQFEVELKHTKKYIKSALRNSSDA